VQSDFSDQSFPRVELALPLPPSSFNSHSLDLQPPQERQTSRSSKSQHEPTRAPRNRPLSNFFSNQTRSSSSLFTLFDFYSLLKRLFRPYPHSFYTTLHQLYPTLPSPLPSSPSRRVIWPNIPLLEKRRIISQQTLSPPFTLTP